MILQKIAQQARLYAEKERARRLKLRIDPIAKDLCGLCAIASRYLFRKLKAAGYQPRIHYISHYGDERHVFVVCNRRIIDVTATQFGYSKIVIMPFSKKRDRWWRDDFLKRNQTLSSEKQLIALQEEEGWYPYRIYSSREKEFWKFWETQ